MIKIEKVSICGLEEAIRGMRSPMNSWAKSNSVKVESCTGCTDSCALKKLNRCEECNLTSEVGIIVGATVYLDITAPLYWWNDYDLMMKLAAGGPTHAKYRRMIKEFDTYKVGTVANSCSTMHKIAAKPFMVDDFSVEHLMADADDNDCPLLQDPNDPDNAFSPQNIFMLTLRMLNACRAKYLMTKKKEHWQQMIQLLPSTYNQKRTVMLNYEVLTGIYPMRKNHKLEEWVRFCKWIESLPYSEVIIKSAGMDDNSINALQGAARKMDFTKSKDSEND